MLNRSAEKYRGVSPRDGCRMDLGGLVSSVFSLKLSRFLAAGPKSGKVIANGGSMQDPAPFDPARRFVRIVEERADGMVEFHFAVGEPELFVEMMLPCSAFEEFCAHQGVQPTREVLLPAESGGEGQSWTLHDARTQRLDRHGPGDQVAPPSD